MKQFHPNERNNELFPGNVTEKDMKPDGVVARRSAIKLSEGPKIAVALPIGGKPLTTVLDCPQCRERGEKHHRFDVTSGFVSKGVVPFQFMLQHMNWLPPLNVTMAYMYKTGMLSAAAREVMTLEVLKNLPTVKYIFYVDDDMVIPPMGLYTMYNRMERNPTWGALSGVYTTRQNPPEPLIYVDHGRGAAWDFEMGEGASPTQIMGAGAGCLLVRVDAIRGWLGQNIDEPVWCDAVEFPASNGGRVTWGHDVRVIRNLTEAGWPCYVEGAVLCGHYDLRTGVVFTVPGDAPGLKKRNINTELYWDAVYGSEGMDTWRKYEAMFTNIEQHLAITKAQYVLELGCGPGVLGQRLTAKLGIKWVGFDLSEVAVAQAEARYLDARVRDVRNLGIGAYKQGYDTIVATELLEHLVWDDCVALLRKLNASEVQQLVFSTPWECMPPSEVPEHMVLVGGDWLDAVDAALSDYVLTSTEKVDEHHRVHVWTKRESKVKRRVRKPAKKVAKKKVK